MSTTQAAGEATTAPAGGDLDHRPQPATRRQRRQRGRGRVWTTIVVVVVLVGGGATVVVYHPWDTNSHAATIDSGAPAALAQVVKGTLSSRTQVNGTLGYLGSYELINRSSGIVTRLPKVGDVIPQGRTLYTVDGKAVIYLQGASAPSYRDLSWGSEGSDVRQLNTALVALGYADKSKLDPDSDYFGRQTYYALKKLQATKGLDDDGTLPLGQVVFAPAKQLRVTEVSGVVGTSAPAGQTILKASSTERQVTVSLNANQQSNVKKGDQVTITMPTGKTTPGRVASVGKVAVKGDETTTVEVLITPSKPAETGSLDQAPVQIAIVSDSVKDVLSVPVTALLALAGGGYAVEVVDSAGTHTLIPVKTGLFDDSEGRVEVSGAGLAEGQNVVVPAT
jgi:hypothetical protein